MDVQPPIAQAPISNTSPQTQCDMGICRFGLGGGECNLRRIYSLDKPKSQTPKPSNFLKPQTQITAMVIL